jgi:class 3 adenylate cyclase
MRTENRVVMLTDIKGFAAATARQTREENARMLALHDALLSPVIEAFGGQRVKTIGDAYLVLFAAPTEALLCAAAIQDRLWDHARRVVEADRIEVRVALAMGDVRLDAGDVFGEAVNLASRIEGEAEPGEVWFSEALYWALDRGRVPVEELGWRTLAGLPEQVRLFRVAHAAVATEGDAPYAGIGLDLVAGLAAPEPERLARVATRRRAAVEAGGSAAAGLRRAGRLLLAALLLAALGAGGWWLTRSPVERALRLGRWEDARAEVEAEARRRGEGDPDVLWLRGRVELARAEAGAGGTVRAAFHHWSRAVAAGSRDAAEALGAEGRSEECARRRLAAHALADSRAREAVSPLEAIAAAEPPAPEPSNALERVKRAVVGDGRCGAGDVAREGVAAIEALHGGRRP